MSDDTSFLLDPRLDADTLPVAELSLSTLRLMDDARFPWLILIPRRAGLADLIDLQGEARTRLTQEIDEVSAALKAVTRCEKLNVAALGNMVRQLHVHIIARFAGDPAWPGPVWGVGERQGYDRADAALLIERLRAELKVD